MRKIGRLLLLITAIALVKCKSNAHKKEKAEIEIETASINGHWKSIGYGRIINITDEIVALYDVNSISCLPSEEFPREAAEQMLSITLKEENKLQVTMGINTYNFNRLEKMPEYCAPLSEAKQNDPVYNFESLCQTFTEQYGYFKERNVDWNALKMKYKSKVSSKSTPLELYITLKEMLDELNDGHVGIELPEELEEAYALHKQTKEAATKKGKRKRIDFDEFKMVQLKKYVKNVNTYNYGLLNWGNINDDVLLLQINGMMQFPNYDIPKDDPEKAEALFEQYAEESENYTQDEIDGATYIMDKVFPDLAKVKTCIIDLRFNGGGMDEVALEILSYFTKQETAVFSKKAYLKEGEFTAVNTVRISPAKKVFDGNIYILTSPLSASATEIFVLSSLKATPKAIRVGSNTEGIFSDILDKKLPNGWNYGLSNEIYESIDGVNYENRGIPPHHRIEYNRESGYTMVSKLQENAKDEAIEKVLELLKEN
ncbi:S41 family peptidase [uncultured Kordia sp.]|uniref:S41 family peptidase n=1 Tax=uncultured Kordia sp. TaxID=507699 RepID=UPI0026240B9A|nr:S41 family peptidase [uncultured Kordia sp.]